MIEKRLQTCAMVLIILLVTILLLNHIEDDSFISNSNQHIRRILSSDYISPETRTYEFSGKKVRSTSSKDLHKAIKDQLIKKRLPEGKTDYNYHTISQAVDKLQEDLGWNEIFHDFQHKSVLMETAEHMNIYDHRLYHDKKVAAHEKKRLEEALSRQFSDIDEKSINTLFDVILLTGNTTTQLTFLEDWREVIEEVHVIIIQQGDSDRHVEVPEWVDYELYTKRDVARAVGAENLWLFDMDADTNQAYNFGFLVADRDFIYLLDRNTKPIPLSSEDEFSTPKGKPVLVPDPLLAPKPEVKPKEVIPELPKKEEESKKPIIVPEANKPNENTEDVGFLPTFLKKPNRRLSEETVRMEDYKKPKKPKIHPLLRAHAMNLRKPALPYYFQALDPFHSEREQKHQKQKTDRNDKFDHPRGSPYTLRNGVQTAFSIGSIIHENQADSLSSLFKNLHHEDANPSKLDSEFQNSDIPDSDIRGKEEVVVTVPYRTMFSLNLQNVALNRKMIGPAFVLLGGIPEFPIGENYDILSGWVLKALCDSTGLGVKHLLSPYHLYNTKGVDKRDLFRSLKTDLYFLEFQEKVVRFFSSVQISDQTGKDDVGDATRELADKMGNELGDLHPAFKKLAEMITTFSHLWGRRNSFHMNLLPVSSRSSAGPPADSPHKCAVFTICHNETYMLEVWLRYYSSHFPQATWVLNHHSGNDEKANHLQIPSHYFKNNTVRLSNLYGDKAGFPMGFFTSQADLMQQRLLRYGFNCVLLSDVDEMVVPDPGKYPQGLTQYVTEFSRSPERKHHRVLGYILAHISQADGEENKNLEPPIDWSQSILKQRSYMEAQPKYNKPLLSKVPFRYKAGFHTVFIPFNIQVDGNLWMFHLRDVDKDTCLHREYQKHQLIQRAHQSEIDMVLNVHIVNYENLKKQGEVCQFALSTYYVKYKGAYDNKGKYRLTEVPERFKNVSV